MRVSGEIAGSVRDEGMMARVYDESAHMKTEEALTHSLTDGQIVATCAV